MQWSKHVQAAMDCLITGDQPFSDSFFLKAVEAKAAAFPKPENTHRKGKDHCLADLHFDWFGSLRS